MIKFSRKGQYYEEFSNFYPCWFNYDGRKYLCSEAAWQSMKTFDTVKREQFAKMYGKDSKAFGRAVQLRPDWEDVKYDLMVDVLKAKFGQNEKLANLLLGTGDEEIVENTTGWHDNIWGNCDCPKCRNIVGTNLLGKALMEVREWLREQK